MKLTEISNQLLAKANLDKKILSISPLAGDASGRQYFRILFSDYSTLILMITTFLKGPIVYSAQFINPNEVFIELSPFLNSKNYRVPKIYAIIDNYLLVEDAGDLPLWHFSLKKSPQSNEATILDLYKKAIDLILRLQSIPLKQDLSAVKRSMQFEQYRTEMERFIDYYLRPKGFNDVFINKVSTFLDILADRVSRHPQSLMHRDFMPWNIHVLPDLSLMVIDYQDMLIGSKAYDIVSLMHDRDADFALGNKLLSQITKYFFDSSTVTPEQYYEIILQRYLRLAGQFNLLSQNLKRECYANWVPGCLKRLGIALKQLPEFSDFATLLSEIPEIKISLHTNF